MAKKLIEKTCQKLDEANDRTGLGKSLLSRWLADRSMPFVFTASIDLSISVDVKEIKECSSEQLLDALIWSRLLAELESKLEWLKKQN